MDNNLEATELKIGSESSPPTRRDTYGWWWCM